MELASILVFVVLTALTVLFFMPFIKLIFYTPFNPNQSKYTSRYLLQQFELLKSQRKKFYLYVSIFGLIFWISLSWMLYEIIGASPSFGFLGAPEIPLRAIVLIILSQIVIWVTSVIAAMKLFDSWGIFKKYPPPDAEPGSILHTEWKKRVDNEITQQSNDRVDHHLMGCFGKGLIIILGFLILTILTIFLIIVFVAKPSIY